MGQVSCAVLHDKKIGNTVYLGLFCCLSLVACHCFLLFHFIVVYKFEINKKKSIGRLEPSALAMGNSVLYTDSGSYEHRIGERHSPPHKEPPFQ